MSAGASGLALLRRAGRLLASLPPALPAVLALLWCSLIWASSSTTIVTGHPGFLLRVVANLTHAPLFGILALLLTAALVPRGGSPAAGPTPADEPRPWPGLGWRSVLVVFLVALYGAVDEWHQSHTKGRDSSALDVLTDLVGAACVVWIVAYVGSPAAAERGLWRRLAAGLVACLACALLGVLA